MTHIYVEQDEPRDPLNWSQRTLTYSARIEDEAGKVLARVSGLSRAKLKKYLKERSTL